MARHRGDCIERVTATRQPTLLPGVPSYVAGLVPYGQEALVVFDMESFLQLGSAVADPTAEQGDEALARLIVVNTGDLTVGIPVAQTGGILPVRPEERRAASVITTQSLRPFLRSEVDTPRGLTGVVDLRAVLEAARV